MDRIKNKYVVQSKIHMKKQIKLVSCHPEHEQKWENIVIDAAAYNQRYQPNLSQIEQMELVNEWTNTDAEKKIFAEGQELPMHIADWKTHKATAEEQTRIKSENQTFAAGTQFTAEMVDLLAVQGVVERCKQNILEHRAIRIGSQGQEPKYYCKTCATIVHEVPTETQS